MRKNLIISLIIMAFLVVYATGALAADKTQVDVYDEQKTLIKSVVFIIGKDEYFINNQTPGVKMDARPFIENGRTFVPVRYLSNALGVGNRYIGWESPRVTLNQPGMPVVELAVGKKEIKSNGKKKAIDVAPLLRKGRTYLPARFVAEALGYEVAWDAKNSIVLCWPKGTEKPDVSDVVEYVKEKLQESNPTNSVEGNVVQFSGEPLDASKYVISEPERALPYYFRQPDAEIKEVTVEELRQHPIKIGNEEDGWMIFYDVKVTEDRIYVTQASSDYSPAPMVLARGNDVTIQRNADVLVEYDKNPFVHGYYINFDGSIPVDIKEVSHFMLMFADKIIAVKNPLYEGGNK